MDERSFLHTVLEEFMISVGVGVLVLAAELAVAQGPSITLTYAVSYDSAVVLTREALRSLGLGTVDLVTEGRQRVVRVTYETRRGQLGGGQVLLLGTITPPRESAPGQVMLFGLIQDFSSVARVTRPLPLRERDRDDWAHLTRGRDFLVEHGLVLLSR